MQKTHCMTDYLIFYNNIWWEKCQKNGKNSIVIPVYKEGEKQKVENYREISLLNARYKLKQKVKQSCYRPGVAQRVPGS
jgi:hypothetical protein